MMNTYFLQLLHSIYPDLIYLLGEPSHLRHYWVIGQDVIFNGYLSLKTTRFTTYDREKRDWYKFLMFPRMSVSTSLRFSYSFIPVMKEIVHAKISRWCSFLLNLKLLYLPYEWLSIKEINVSNVAYKYLLIWNICFDDIKQEIKQNLFCNLVQFCAVIYESTLNKYNAIKIRKYNNE